MAFIKRQKEIEIFGNKYLLTPWGVDDKSRLEEKFGISALSIEMAMIGEKLESPKVSEQEKIKLEQRNDEIIKNISSMDTAVNCELVDIHTRNTPDRPSMEEIKSDATAFGILLQKVLRFKNGNEHYEKTVLNILRTNLIKHTEEKISVTEVLKLIANIEQEILNGEYKKKE